MGIWLLDELLRSGGRRRASGEEGVGVVQVGHDKRLDDCLSRIAREKRQILPMSSRKTSTHLCTVYEELNANVFWRKHNVFYSIIKVAFRRNHCQKHNICYEVVTDVWAPELVITSQQGSQMGFFFTENRRRFRTFFQFGCRRIKADLRLMAWDALSHHNDI